MQPSVAHITGLCHKILFLSMYSTATGFKYFHKVVACKFLQEQENHKLCHVLSGVQTCLN